MEVDRLREDRGEGGRRRGAAKAAPRGKAKETGRGRGASGRIGRRSGVAIDGKKVCSRG